MSRCCGMLKVDPVIGPLMELGRLLMIDRVTELICRSCLYDCRSYSSCSRITVVAAALIR